MQAIPNAGDLSERRMAGDRKDSLVQLKKEYVAPRRYYFVSPHGVGTTLAGYLANAEKLKKVFMENWYKHVRQAITETQEVILEGEFLAYVDAFDFSIFDSKTAL